MPKSPDLSSHLNQAVKSYTNPDVVKIAESAIIPDACKQMIKANIDEIIVVDKNENPIGLVTDEDVLKKTSEALVNPSKTTLGDIMTFPVISINQNKTLSDALKQMHQYKIRKLVVLSDENKIVGMLYKNTIISIMKNHLAAKHEKHSSFWSIIWNLGIVLQFAGVLMFIPAVIATILWETVPATGIYLMSTLLFVTGFFMNTYGERRPLKLRDVAILVFVSFMLLVLFGTIPHMLVVPHDASKPLENFANSFFESSAGFTTGGLSLISTPEKLPQSFTFYRSYTQFVGGLSFVYLIVTTFFPEHKLRTMRSFISGKVPQLRELLITITILFSIYITIIAVALFYLGKRNLIDNFSLAMSAVSTGGWIPNSQILSGLTIPEHLVIIAGMILGALPFGFHYAFVRTKFMSVHISKEVALYFVIMVISLTTFLLSMNVNSMDSIFNIVSASTTTGFQTINLQNLNPIAGTIITVAMLIGGCGFSTAGGIKVFRLINLIGIKNIFRKTMTPSNKNEIITAIILVISFPVIPLFVASHMHSLGYDFEDSYFDAVSALTTTGLGAGTVTASLDSFTITIFSFLMILGRIEIILLLYMFIPKLIP
ncbi:MAG TPA: potassium transporter TrkG [Candidatus Nitrosotenuis sp.]|nr:potassium transporter TrkG [Candidatus Nitrosotenuis sp.]